MENEILLILACSGKSEVDGILALAEVCCSGYKGAVKNSQDRMEIKKEGLFDSLEAIEECLM